MWWFDIKGPIPINTSQLEIARYECLPRSLIRAKEARALDSGLIKQEFNLTCILGAVTAR